MNRRAFLASIPFLPAAAKAALQPSIVRPADFLDMNPKLWKCVITPNVKEYTLRSVAWSTEFSRPERWLFLHHLTEREYREHRLKQQLAMPAPKLP